MPDQTLSPTAHIAGTTGAGTVVNPENAYDGDLGTHGSLNAPGLLDEATLTLLGFGDDDDVAVRGVVVVQISMSEVAWSPTDSCAVYFRPAAADPWTRIGIFYVGSLISPSWREIDVSSLAGSTPSSEWQVGIAYARNFDPPDPM